MCGATPPSFRRCYLLSGAAWTNWGKTPGETDAVYIGNLALAQLGLERDETVVAVEPEAPAEAAPAE